MLKGDNTVCADVVRVLMRSVTANKGQYDPELFVQDFVEFMTTPPKDPYRDVATRRWFENYSRGADPMTECAGEEAFDSDAATIAGMLAPLTAAMLAATTATSSADAVALALRQLRITHQSPSVAEALTVAVPLLVRLLLCHQEGGNAAAAFRDAAALVQLPGLHGVEMAKLRQAAASSPNGSEEWRQARCQRDEAKWDLLADPTRIEARLSTGPYVEHAFPLSLVVAANNGFDLERALLANANAGGDSSPRGALLGLLLGAASAEIPQSFKSGLSQYPALQKEIAAFAACCLSPSSRRRTDQLSG